MSGTNVPKGAARREPILRATLELIGERGPDAVTHRAVAERAGLPLSATTYWFDSKEELLQETLLLAAREEVERLERLVLDLAPRELDVARVGRARCPPCSPPTSRRTRSARGLHRARARGHAPPLARARRWRAGTAAQLRLAELGLRAAGSPDPAPTPRWSWPRSPGFMLGQLVNPRPDFEERVFRPALERLFASLTERVAVPSVSSRTARPGPADGPVALLRARLSRSRPTCGATLHARARPTPAGARSPPTWPASATPSPTRPAPGSATWSRSSASARELGLERCVLVVHDWGGLIGLRWACEHPEAVRGARDQLDRLLPRRQVARHGRGAAHARAPARSWWTGSTATGFGGAAALGRARHRRRRDRRVLEGLRRRARAAAASSSSTARATSRSSARYDGSPRSACRCCCCGARATSSPRGRRAPLRARAARHRARGDRGRRPLRLGRRARALRRGARPAFLARISASSGSST